MARKRGAAKLAGAAAKGLMKPLEKVAKEGEELVEVVEETAAKGAKKATKAARGARPKREIPQEVRDRWNRGNAFNKEREPHYTEKGGGNELTLGNDKRVDSYVPGKEIVSRKHTQFSEIKEETGIDYVRELDNKYSPGEVVKDTQHARDQIGDHAGTPLRGDKILEVPPQNGDIPKSVLDEAERRGITIRDTNGKVYENPVDDD
jgi:predicted DNA-binding antitoxin AbrB/MazE fold protein